MITQVEVGCFQSHHETIQVVMLHQPEELLNQLVSAGEIVGHGEAASGLSAVLEEKATGVLRHYLCTLKR